MWWLLFVAGVVAFLIFCVLYLEFRGHRGAKYDRTTESGTNHQVLGQQSNSTRNQSGFL